MTRRTFLETNLLAAAASPAGPPAPWYRRTLRWGQTNITEADPPRYDIPFWRGYWKRTAIQGVIVNAGGIVAYYPSKFPLHHRAQFLNGRDLFGELTTAAHADGLAVLARMDSNRAAEDMFRAHPDWFARNSAGDPYRADDKYVTCVNSPYYDDYLPQILREIIERSHPEGFTDNSWSGLDRNSICYCDNCARRFRDAAGHPLPRARDWSSPVYRQWIEWNYARRLELWDLNNRVTQSAGGPDCLWIGMSSGSISSQARSFRNFPEICKRSQMVLLDHQSRADSTGFQQNAEAGKLVHGLLGWDKLMPESMALYQNAAHQFRLAAKPAPESRQWMISGIAGGIQPWWHHVGAFHEDRRAYRTAEPIFRWHQQNERYLIDRKPVAAIGVVWSQRNTDYYGREEAADLVDAPYRGLIQALIRARIPYAPVFIDHIDRDGAQFAALVLPNLGAMSDSQCDSIRKFVSHGGGLIATGASSLFDEWGDPRPDFALADLYGAHAPARAFPRRTPAVAHTYLRIEPATPRHEIFRGFEETAILPFGGTLDPIRTDPTATVPLTFIPAFPTYPPETAWMRTPKTDIAALVLRTSGAARIAYTPSDLDRRYFTDNMPDHATLLANLARWAANGRIPLEIRGPGLLDCHLYTQPGRLILHIVNLSNEAAWRAPMDELIPVGPLQVRIQLPPDVHARHAQLLVAQRPLKVSVQHGWLECEVPRVSDHEAVLVE